MASSQNTETKEEKKSKNPCRACIGSSASSKEALKEKIFLALIAAKGGWRNIKDATTKKTRIIGIDATEIAQAADDYADAFYSSSSSESSSDASS